MSFDESLAERIRGALPKMRGISEKKMFGGIAFMLNGKMFCGVIKTDLMVRVGPEKYEDALVQPHARPMDFTGRPMAGYVFVAPQGCRRSEVLEKWIGWGIEYASFLPAKPAKKTKPRTGRVKK